LYVFALFVATLPAFGKSSRWGDRGGCFEGCTGENGGVQYTDFVP
jgi:hypothetical protein